MDEHPEVTATLAVLALQAQEGDAASTEDLLVRLVPEGHRLAFAMVHDTHAADDIVQDACLKAWRKLRQLRNGSDPRTWFLGIVANECRSFRRSRWVRTVASVGTASAPSREMTDVAGSLSVRTALASLSRDDQTVLILRYYMDLSVEQTAVTLALSPGAVRSRAHRASNRLRALVEGD